MNTLSGATQGFTGADLTELCCRACKLAIRESIEKDNNREEKQQATLNIEEPNHLPQIRADHFAEALKSARRSVSDNDMHDYDIFTQSLIQRSLLRSGNKNRKNISYLFFSRVGSYHDDDDLYN